LNNLPQEALDRRARSLEILTRESVPYMAQLPVIETSEEAKLRTKDEICYRALSLLTVALKGEGLEQSIVERIVREHGLDSYLTAKESAFIANPSPSDRDRIPFSWRYECAWVLLWALNYVEELERPSQICDVVRSVGFMKDRTTSEFLAGSKERSIAEILDQADLIYRYHWAVVSARLKGEPPPQGLIAGVVQERHHALNWLIGYMDQVWDDVTTDT
jgi:hypothetical protein